MCDAGEVVEASWALFSVEPACTYEVVSFSEEDIAFVDGQG